VVAVEVLDPDLLVAVKFGDACRVAGLVTSVVCRHGAGRDRVDARPAPKEDMVVVDIAAFVLQNVIYPYPTSSLPKISPCFPLNRLIAFWLQRAKVLG